MATSTPNSNSMIPAILIPLLQSTKDDARPVVVMTCGISGAGKSTLSKAIVSAYPNFTRLSIDTIVHARQGMYGIDFPASEYSTYQEEAAEIFQLETTHLLSTTPPSNLVLDRSYYAKSDRDRYRTLTEAAGARVILVYLEASKEVLWRRIRERTEKGRDADSAMEVTEEVLDRYLKGFEAPNGEGEVVVRVT